MKDETRKAEMREALQNNTDAYRKFMEEHGDPVRGMFAIADGGEIAMLFRGCLQPQTARQAYLKPRNVGARYHAEHPGSHIMVAQLGQAEPLPYFVS